MKVMLPIQKAEGTLKQEGFSIDIISQLAVAL